MTGSLERGRGSRGEAKTAEPEARLREYLRSRKLRMTPERKWVLQGVLSRDGHFDAEDLLAFLHRRNMPVSRATLYRTLEHLTASGLVKMHRFGRGHALFERNYGRHHHDHMVCDSCGKVIEFVNNEIERLQDQVCDEHGFQPTNHVMQIFGLCSDCSRRDEGEVERTDRRRSTTS